MGRGTVIAVCGLLAAVGASATAVRGQSAPGALIPVRPLVSVRVADPLPPLPDFDKTEKKAEPKADEKKAPKAGQSVSRQPTRTPGSPPRPELLPDGSGVVLPATNKQTIRFGPRYGKLNDYTVDKRPDGTQRLTYSGGLKVNVVTQANEPGQPPQEVEFAANNVVIWVRGLRNTADLVGGLDIDRTPKPNAKPGDTNEPAKDEKVTVELYLSGDVVIRTLGTLAVGPAGTPPAQQILRAEEIYYDVDKERAVALDADLETKFPTGLDSVHLRGREIDRLGKREWHAYDTTLFSSKRPADPALTITSREATLVERSGVVKKNIFGRPFRNLRTGEIDVSDERTLTGYKNRVRVRGVPLLFIPRYKTDLSDPTGPLVSFLFRQDIIFGSQFYSTFDVYKLLAIRPPPNRSWRLHADYLSLRGPAVGTNYQYRDILFGSAYPNSGQFNAYVIQDKGEDLLSAFRGVEPLSSSAKDRTRGRVHWNHNQALYEDGTDYARAVGQFAFLSDKNFYEQYYKQLFDSNPNEETFLQAYGAFGNFTWSGLAQANVNRPWVTETNWLPRGDAALTGQTWFNDLFVTSSRATAGYAQFKPASQAPLPLLPSEARAVDTGLFDVNHRVGVPLDAGPFRIEPYAVGNATLYSQNLNGDADARLYGGGGVSASIPFSRLYPDLNSELFNVRGIHHKVTAGANFFTGYASSDRRNFPLLNRLNDDNLDLTYRTWRPLSPFYISGPGGLALQNSPIFDPQTLAVRKLLDNRPETLDTLQVVQLDLKQRWQTKRGLPGADHTVDWMSLNLSASVFPNPTRDNFGSVLGFLEYDYVWNIGDRTALASSGWVDPNTNGAKYVNIGAFYSRPDGSNLYLGYRYTDPVNSRVLITTLGYQLSTKYSLSLTNAFDFGSNLAQSTQATFNRTGTDVTMSFGFSFSALVPGNNLGFQFLLVPNAVLAAGGQRSIGPLAVTGVR